MQQRRSFVTETVFSHPPKLALIDRPRRLGFVVVLDHIHVSTPELAAARVRSRVSAGGHDVPLQKLAARHARTLALLPRAVLIADRAHVFDNSRLDRSFPHVLTCEAGPLRRLGRSLPEWGKTTYGDALRAYLEGRRVPACIRLGSKRSTAC